MYGDGYTEIRRPIVEAARFSQWEVRDYLLGMGAAKETDGEIWTEMDEERMRERWEEAGYGGWFWKRKPFSPRRNEWEMHAR